jgi:hypothetical protein
MQYRVLEPIKHNALRLGASEIIDLTDAEAAPLLEVGAVEPVDLPYSKKIKTPCGDNP